MPVIVGAAAKVTWSSSATGTAALAVRQPDGTTLSPAPTVTGSGQYSADVATAQPGRHLLTWTAAGAVWVDVLDVWPADPRYLVSLEEAIAALGSVAASQRADLPLQVATATWVIESLVGPLLPDTRAARHHGPGGTLLLPDQDVAGVAATLDGVPFALAAADVDEEAGIVYRLPSTGLVRVTYQVGSTKPLPANLRLATLELVAHLWRSGRQTGHAGAVEAAADTVSTPFGFAIPRRVVELCGPHALLGGFA